MMGWVCWSFSRQHKDLVEMNNHSILLFVGLSNLLMVVAVVNGIFRVNTGEIDFVV